MPHYQVKDRYFQKAKEEGYRARSVYKLKEIDEKLDLFHPKMRVLDLGAYPGSWTQYTAPRVKEVIAVDLKELDPLNKGNVTIIVGDALEQEFEGQFDVILSDMAPSTSGIKYRDQKKIIDLNRGVLNLAKKYLHPNGLVISKIFQGFGFDNFIQELKKMTSEVKVMKVKATRAGSTERYLIYRL